MKVRKKVKIKRNIKICWNKEIKNKCKNKKRTKRGMDTKENQYFKDILCGSKRKKM